MGSPQTLSEADRRIVAVWAADCAERVLGLFEAEAPGDGRPRDAIARLRAFARGELGVGEARRRFVAHAAAREVSAPAAVAAARAAGHAASVPHMGAHALGAAAYAATAAGLAAPDRLEAVSEEIRWQFGRMSAAARAALRQLPPVGENSSGPLGPGLLASGLLSTIIRELQASLADPEQDLPRISQSDQGHGRNERGSDRPLAADGRVLQAVLRVGGSAWLSLFWPAELKGGDSGVRFPVRRAAGASVTVVGSDARRFGRGSESLAPIRRAATRPAV